MVHHTQLLAHLVSTGRLTPVQPVDGGVTYHDPCYLGRHNRVFAPPREVLGSAINGGGNADSGLIEMPRNSERSFCCGAGGARMWMEERIGKRINVERVEEAMSTGARTVAVGCPFCSTMLTDGVNGKGGRRARSRWWTWPACCSARSSRTPHPVRRRPRRPPAEAVPLPWTNARRRRHPPGAAAVAVVRTSW